MGMREVDPASPVPEAAIRPGQVVMDIVYKPIATELWQAARRRGATAVHGGRMLLHQAARSGLSSLPPSTPSRGPPFPTVRGGAMEPLQRSVMADELVRTTEALMGPEVCTLDRAVRALYEVFGPLVDADYLPGKTELRDALAARFELSQLVAEELCDELERAGRLRFVTTAEGAAWHIHRDEAA